MRSLKEILAPISEEMKLAEQLAFKNITTDIGLLTQVGKYILESGGKRIRPALLLLSNGIFGAIERDAGLAAGIIEYIHTATLLHDDVIDNAETRRNRKTANTVWGNEAAVLVGDYLFTTSFKLIAELNSIPLIKTLSECTTMMAKGEILQLIREYDSADEAEYYSIIEHKTSSLMAAGMKIGAILGQASEDDQETMREIGSKIGFAFQIIDDALDYSPENKKTGKDFGTDLKERKITLPLIHLLQNCDSTQAEKIKTILNAETVSDENFFSVKKMMDETDSIQFSLDKAAGYSKEALALISGLPKNSYRQSLEELVLFMTQRGY